jgi:hypothetical protein
MTSWEYTYLSTEDAGKALKKLIKEEKIRCTKQGYVCTNYDSYEYSQSARAFDITIGKQTINKAKEYYSCNFDLPYKDVKVKRVPHLDKFIEINSRKQVDSYTIRKKYQEEGFKRFLQDYKNNFCMIRTDNGFWHQSHAGYTQQSRAGIFPIEGAFKAISHCGLSKCPQLYIVIKEDLEGYREPLQENLERLNRYINILETGENK